MQKSKRFMTMQSEGKKVSWCLPVFLFGLLFGLPGMAIWFLYRKMNRPAVALLAVSFAMRALNIILNFELIKSIYRSAFGTVTALFGGNFFGLAAEFKRIAEFIGEQINRYSENSVSVNLPLVSLALEIALPVFAGLFSLALYKKYCMKRIFTLKRELTDRTVYISSLSRVGGVSVGRVFVGMIIYVALLVAVSMLPFAAVVLGF